MIDGQRIVCILASNPARANLIKSACLISQKRPAKFAASPEASPGQVPWLDAVICDMAGDADLNELASWARRVEQSTFASIKVIFITEEGASPQWAKTKLLGKGIDFLWDERLLLDPRANWARVLKSLEDAAAMIGDGLNKVSSPPPTASTAAPKIQPASPAASPPPVRPTAPLAPTAFPKPAAQPIPAPPSVFRPTAAPSVFRPAAAPTLAPRPATAPAPSSAGRDGRALPPTIVMPAPRAQLPIACPYPAIPATKILLVDDSANARAFVEKRVRDSWDGPLEFDFAETGASAQTKCLAVKYDILFLDIVLPDLDGYAVCKSLKNTKNVGSLAVMLTSKGGAFDKLKGMMSGCDLYIVKPIEPEHVAEVHKKHKANLAARGH